MTHDLSHTYMPSGYESDLLERYLSGRVDRADTERIERWLDGNPHAKVVVNVFLDGVTGRGENAPDSYAFLEWLHTQIRKEGCDGQGTGEDTHPEKLLVPQQLSGRQAMLRGASKGQNLRRSIWYSAVGVLAVASLIIIGWTGLAYQLKPNSHFVPTEYTTANGQRATITLADGSTVLLNVASRLTVPADYAAGNHTVHLVGEALFTVSHQDRTPFTVLAGPATTRVLGTSFLVRHYATDSATTVAVRDGKVAVHAMSRKPVVLTAARQVKIGRTGEADVQITDPAQFSFATGILTLKDVPFPEAIAELDRWYDVDIRLGDPALKTRRVMGENAAGSLTDLKALLEWTFNVRVVRHGRVLTLFPR